LTGDDQVYVYRSMNAGATWSTIPVDTVQIGPACTAAGCPSDYYPGHSAISADANGNLVVLYDGATMSGGNETVWTKRSTDGGAVAGGLRGLRRERDHVGRQGDRDGGRGQLVYGPRRGLGQPPDVALSRRSPRRPCPRPPGRTPHSDRRRDPVHPTGGTGSS